MIIIETQQQNPLWTLNTYGAAAAAHSFFFSFSPYYFMSFGQIESFVYHHVRRVYMQFVGSEEREARSLCR